MTLLNHVQAIVLNPWSHVLLALGLVVLASFGLLRSHKKNGRLGSMGFTIVGILPLVYALIQLFVLTPDVPRIERLWLLDQGLPVTTLSTFTAFFLVVGVLELMLKHSWQAFAYFTLAAGSVTLALEFHLFANGDPKDMAIVMPVAWLLTVLMAAAFAATGLQSRRQLAHSA